MKLTLLFTTIFYCCLSFTLFASTYTAQEIAQDIEAAKKSAVNDYLLELKKPQLKNVDIFKVLGVAKDNSCVERCVQRCDRPSTDTGSSGSCYSACSTSGWSFSYCNDKCGRSPDCYDTCSQAGWSFSYCNDKCK
ncbi:MAG: hypothetical protein U0T83_08670 [Bacteriovoracaceae bacterium]